MGTTLTAALVDGDEVSFAHVGDSRAYLFRDDELKLLTSDHSLVEELRRQGRLTEAQAADHPQRSIITRALGPESRVEIDTLTFSARPGDVFLLCSDGLTTMVKDAQIAEIIAGSANLVEATTRLVHAANDAGGRDNITVVAFRVADAADVSAEEGATLIGPSADEAGLSGPEVRAAAARGDGARDRRAQPPRRRRMRTAAKLLAVALVIGAVAAGAWLGARQVYFLGTDEGGRLSLYRGLPYDLPFGVELYTEVYSIPVQVGSLPEERRESAINHELRGRDDAVSLLDDLEAAAAAAAPPSPDPQGGGGGGAGSSGGATDSAGEQGGSGDSGGRSQGSGSASGGDGQGAAGSGG